MRRYLVIAGVVACLATLVAVASADPRANTTYKGNTSQHYNASVRTDVDGTALRSFTIRRKFDCGNQSVTGTFRQSTGIMVIKPDRRFWGHDNVTPSTAGAIKRGVFTIRGRFSPGGGSARGTYRERVRLKNGTRCDTGEIRYRVKAR